MISFLRFTAITAVTEILSWEGAEVCFSHSVNIHESANLLTYSLKSIYMWRLMFFFCFFFVNVRHCVQ